LLFPLPLDGVLLIVVVAIILFHHLSSSNVIIIVPVATSAKSTAAQIPFSHPTLRRMIVPRHKIE